MHRLKSIALVFLISTFGCVQNNCPPDINKKPMYGRIEKCPEQIEIDKEFIKQCETYYENNEQATAHHINMAWEYFYENKLDSAMMRFNQAWLLDSSNADVYWGFGNILGRTQKFKESLYFFEKSLELNPDNSKTWLSASTSHGQLFFLTKNKEQLDKSIEYLKKSISLDSNNIEAYANLTAAYSYFMQKDSARKYLQLTERLDPNAINPEVRKLLNEK